MVKLLLDVLTSVVVLVLGTSGAEKPDDFNYLFPRGAAGGNSLIRSTNLSCGGQIGEVAGSPKRSEQSGSRYHCGVLGPCGCYHRRDRPEI